MVLFQENLVLPSWWKCTTVWDLYWTLGNKLTCMIYMDMSKTFDKVNHQILIHKLYNCFGISGSLLGWFSSYLLNRRQRVTVLARGYII
jgi:hypothetical protein